jgi:hypothetical protein
MTMTDSPCLCRITCTIEETNYAIRTLKPTWHFCALHSSAGGLLRAAVLALDNLKARSQTRRKWTVNDQSTFEALKTAIAEAVKDRHPEENHD